MKATGEHELDVDEFNLTTVSGMSNVSNSKAFRLKDRPFVCLNAVTFSLLAFKLMNSVLRLGTIIAQSSLL